MVKSDATILLMHGAWADGSSWNKVIPSAASQEYAGHRRQLPLTSVEDDLAATNRIVADTDRPCRSQLGWNGCSSGIASAEPLLGLRARATSAPGHKRV
jgi:hypothetical protein